MPLPELSPAGATTIPGYFRSASGETSYSLTPQVAKQLELPVERGVLIIRVDAGGQGWAAGRDP